MTCTSDAKLKELQEEQQRNEVGGEFSSSQLVASAHDSTAGVKSSQGIRELAGFQQYKM